MTEMYTQRLQQANAIVKQYMFVGMGVGAGVAAIPVPLTPWLDLGALSALNLKMLHSLTAHYHIPFRKEVGKELIGSLLAGALPAGGAVPLAKGFLKLVPGVGLWACIVSSSALAGTATYALGQVFIQHFETGGTLFTFDPAKVREHFMAELEKGKQFAAETSPQS